MTPIYNQLWTEFCFENRHGGLPLPLITTVKPVNILDRIDWAMSERYLVDLPVFTGIYGSVA